MSALRGSSRTADRPWPDSLEALVAAPRHHTLLLETDRVRVLETHIPPGELVPLHTRRWPSVLYVLSRSDFVRRDAEGHVLSIPGPWPRLGPSLPLSGRRRYRPIRWRTSAPRRSASSASK